MGKTVETYRMALDDEIRRWSGFAKALRSGEREAFETLMDACRGYASAGNNAVQPILFEPMNATRLGSAKLLPRDTTKTRQQFIL